VVGAQGPALIRAETVLVASGTHAPAPDFENNDVPGVISARAALMALRHGVSVGRRVAVVGQGRFARHLVELCRGRVECVELPADSGLRVIGRTAITRVLVQSGGAERRLRFDALALDGPGAPAFELCVQAGASLRFEAERGYLPERDDSGQLAPQVFAAGSVCGARESGADGERVARGLVSGR
jgi:sarcosine oxidase subunit alpha